MAPSDNGRTFYVIVRNEDDEHWTNHSDFVDGKFFGDRASASAHLKSLMAMAQPSTSPTTSAFPHAPLVGSPRPSPGARADSTSSASTICSSSSSNAVNVRYEVRRIAAKPLCGSWTWWFVDEEGKALAGKSALS